MDKKILVTGGCGYIGSHTLISLSMAGYIPIVLDNLSNSSLEALKQVENILGERIKFYNVDILDKLSLKKIFLKMILRRLFILQGLNLFQIHSKDQFLIIKIT